MVQIFKHFWKTVLGIILFSGGYYWYLLYENRNFFRLKRRKIARLKYLQNVHDARIQILSSYSHTSMGQVKYLDDVEERKWYYGFHYQTYGPEINVLGEYRLLGSAEKLMFLKKTLEIFGYLSYNNIPDLWAQTTEVKVTQGELLIKPGDYNDKIYIVLEGSFEVGLYLEGDESESYLTGNYFSNREYSPLKIARAGGRILSILSFLEALSGKKLFFTDITVRALEESTVLVVPISFFKDLYKNDMDVLLHFSKVLCHRVFQTIFIFCHKILGLGVELVRQNPEEDEYTIVDFSISPEVKRKAIEKLMIKLDIESDDENLFDGSELVIFQNRKILYEEGKTSDKIYFVVEGSLEATILSYTIEGALIGEEFLLTYQKNELVGSLILLTEVDSFFTIKATNKVLVLSIPTNIIKKIVSSHPHVFFRIVDDVVSRLTFFTREIEFALEWCIYEHGELVYKVGDIADSTFIILSGRLRSLLKNTEGMLVNFGEYGIKDWVGLVEVLTKRNRNKSLMAVRDTEVAKVPNFVLNKIKRENSKVTNRLLFFLGQRVIKTHIDEKYLDSLNLHYNKETIPSWGIERPETTKKAKTVGLIPLTEDIPVHLFGEQLVKSYLPGEESLLYTEEKLHNDLGREEDNRASTLTWFAHLERKYSLVVFIGDHKPSKWNTKFLKRVDVVLFLTIAQNEDRTIREIESRTIKDSPLSRKELVLFQKVSEIINERGLPEKSKLWLKPRKWLSMHHHVRYEQIINCDMNEPINKVSDVGRILRWLTGKSIAIVFGSGGAKAGIHIGILRCLIFTKIPLDLAGGASIGSLLAALFAIYYNTELIYKDVSAFFHKMNEFWRFLFDMTLPIVGVYTGNAFNNILIKFFGDVQIEDLWIPFFCISTDLTYYSIRAHRCGPLWLYLRASMNLATYFSPVCDPIDGHLLMDGAYINSVPAEPMRQGGAKYIIAIDVEGESWAIGKWNFANDILSGLKILFYKIFPFASDVKNIPSGLTILEQLSYVQSALTIQIVKKMDSLSIYIHPPHSPFNSKDYKRIKEMQEFGFDYGKEIFYEEQGHYETFDDYWKRISIRNKKIESYYHKLKSDIQDYKYE